MQQQWLETASKAFEANMTALTQIGEKNTKSAQELFDKQVNTAKACFETSQAKVQDLAAAKDFSAFVTIQSDLMVECYDQGIKNYNELLTVTTAAQSELSQLAETTFSDIVKAGEQAVSETTTAFESVAPKAEAAPVKAEAAPTTVEAAKIEVAAVEPAKKSAAKRKPKAS